MGLTVLPYGEEHIPLVQRFNERLKTGGSSWAFYPHPVPKWLPRRPAGGAPGLPRAAEPASVWREFFVDWFGDNSMIPVVVFRKGEEEWGCDIWLMSCRMLGRRVEEGVLAAVACAARATGATDRR